MDRLVCLGLSHRTAPVELRERLSTLGPEAGRCPAVDEHAVLSTCYRVELYAYLEDGVEEAREELIGVLAAGHGVERELLVDHLYVHAGEDVARHLGRVAAGLDSLVLGEAEILGQVGDAFEESRAAGTAGPALSLLFRTAIAAGAPRSYGDRHRREPRDCELDGAGARRGRARRSARQARARRRSRADRAPDAEGRARPRHRPDRGREPDAGARGGGRELRSAPTAYGLDELERGARVGRRRRDGDQLGGARRLAPERSRAAMAGREERPLVLVDLAVPADVERSAGEVGGARLFDVDDLRAGLDDALASRLREVPAVEAIVEDEVDAFGRRYRELEVEPLVAALRRQAEAIRDRSSSARCGPR